MKQKIILFSIIVLFIVGCGGANSLDYVIQHGVRQGVITRYEQVEDHLDVLVLTRSEINITNEPEDESFVIADELATNLNIADMLDATVEVEFISVENRYWLNQHYIQYEIVAITFSGR